jgi:predicted nucleotidyltransferase component of viral defense system
VLTKKEIVDYAKLNNNSPYQQEKHYIQSCILSTIAEEKIVFKGGTYLWFFHGLQRFSEDLDFTAFGEVRGLEQKVINSLKLIGIESEVKKIEKKKEGFSFRVDAKGPLYENDLSKNFVYVEISQRDDLVLKPLNLVLKNTNYFISERNVLGMSLQEVVAEKIRAIITRNKPRDIFDLNFLITEKNVVFDKKLVQKKMDYYKEKFSESKFKTALKEKEKSYFNEMNYLVNSRLSTFDEVEKRILNWINN